MDRIICPHCKYEYDDGDMIQSDNDLWKICTDERTVDEKCVLCGKTFWIEVEYKPVYKTHKTEDDCD
jgi:hypothetical protein